VNFSELELQKEFERICVRNAIIYWDHSKPVHTSVQRSLSIVSCENKEVKDARQNQFPPVDLIGRIADSVPCTSENGHV